jgi:uncharacterized protein (TIGR03437 family)
MPKTSLLVLFAAVCLTPVAGLGQPSRIIGKIDNAQRITLAGHLHPRALPQYDQGPVDPNMVLGRVTVELQRSPAQQAALQQLLAEQQNPSSPNYHEWLTPQQFGDQFGASQDDINKIVEWLKSQNLTVASVAPARNAIAVSGTAATVEKAFGVEIHRYVIDGESHFANSTNPSVPAAFSGVIGGIRGLNNFRLRPQLKSRTIVPHAGNPRYTDSQGNHYLAPEDVATIYNITPLHSAGLNGSGQKIVVVGQTDIRTADIDQFRSTFNLPAINLQQVLVPGSADPGVIPPCEPSTPASEECGDLSEADLDLELSGAVAPNATIIFVYADPNTTGGVETAVEYAIQQNLAPVISMSYGDCEYAYSASQVTSMQQLAQQANAQGITWFAASGDNGATDCYGDTFPDADDLVSVDMPGSIPEVTAVGGTEFVDTSSNWNATNDANLGSALGYIPETAWNDSAEDGSPSASGGGASIYFSKPSWQAGEGVPNDGARDVPDIAISASADHDGYIIYTSDGCEGTRSTSTCQMIVGGTSVGAPQMSGLFTLLNQQLVSSGAQSSPGLGNINPELYSLFNSAYAADYHDITTGNNDIAITCTRFERGCTSGNVGYSAGPGYDQVTGIGSLNANALLTGWKGNSSGTGSSGTGGSGGGQSSTPAPAISGITNAASFQQGFAPGELVSVFGSGLAPAAQGASSVPLPVQMQGVTATVNNLPAYLDYVSASQINLQIPYELASGSTATLTIDNNGSMVSTTFPVTAAAPGIFADSNDAPVPNTSAAPGQTVTLFITGAGAVTPAINDGVAPAATTPIGNLPVPTQSVTVTIGGLGGVAGITAPTTFVGIPEALVGVVQINYTVPANVPLGPQPIVVTVGGVASTAATLTIQ